MKRIHFIALLTTMLFGGFTLGSAQASDFPKGSPKFVSSMDAALKAAKTEGKPIILVFSASWCGPCQANKKNVYPDAKVTPYHDKFIWAYIDADEKTNMPAMEKFNVTGIPHIEFLSKDGKSLGQLIGATKPEAFTKQLDNVLKKVS